MGIFRRWRVSLMALAVAGCTSTEIQFVESDSGLASDGGAETGLGAALDAAGANADGDVPRIDAASANDSGPDVVVADASDAGTAIDARADAVADADAGPVVLYPNAIDGSFGWPCTPDDGGAIASPNCTDPMYPYCFVGGQGSWCTKVCAGATQAIDCPVPPTSGVCNGKGYCK